MSLKQKLSNLMQEITESKIKSDFRHWLKSDYNRNGISDYLEDDPQ